MVRRGLLALPGPHTKTLAEVRARQAELVSAIVASPRGAAASVRSEELSHIDFEIDFREHRMEQARQLPVCDLMDIIRERMPKFQHIKRGSTYSLLAEGLFQCVEEVFDQTPVVVYQDYTGVIWVRPASEFFDTERFTPL